MRDVRTLRLAVPKSVLTCRRRGVSVRTWVQRSVKGCQNCKEPEMQSDVRKKLNAPVHT